LKFDGTSIHCAQDALRISYTYVLQQQKGGQLAAAHLRARIASGDLLKQEIRLMFAQLQKPDVLTSLGFHSSSPRHRLPVAGNQSSLKDAHFTRAEHLFTIVQCSASQRFWSTQVELWCLGQTLAGILCPAAEDVYKHMAHLKRIVVTQKKAESVFANAPADNVTLGQVLHDIWWAKEMLGKKCVDLLVQAGFDPHNEALMTYTFENESGISNTKYPLEDLLGTLADATRASKSKSLSSARAFWIAGNHGSKHVENTTQCDALTVLEQDYDASTFTSAVKVRVTDSLMFHRQARYTIDGLQTQLVKMCAETGGKSFKAATPLADMRMAAATALIAHDALNDFANVEDAKHCRFLKQGLIFYFVKSGTAYLSLGERGNLPKICVPSVNLIPLKQQRLF
jgi:hypothetical protein